MEGLCSACFGHGTLCTPGKPFPLPSSASATFIPTFRPLTLRFSTAERCCHLPADSMARAVPVRARTPMPSASRLLTSLLPCPKSLCCPCPCPTGQRYLDDSQYFRPRQWTPHIIPFFPEIPDPCKEAHLHFTRLFVNMVDMKWHLVILIAST